MSKIEFHEITLDDKTWMDARFQEDDRNACEYLPIILSGGKYIMLKLQKNMGVQSFVLRRREW